ncbi:MAG: endonuclease/exonuclease/phosphatase family protein [Bacteroidia bacterium]|nr:endonuclease/exonuclease/phosphatase family protein [Bacteroidia bacterium]
MRRMLLGIVFAAGLDCVFAQNLRIAAYNVENLFDLFDDPKTQDEDFTPSGKLNWTEERVRQKHRRLAEVWDSLAPDLIGLLEIENRRALEAFLNDYKKRKYAFVLYEGRDERGIDPALVYDPKKFRLLASRALRVNLSGLADTTTRDVLVAALQIRQKPKDTLHVAVNHWPSRRNPPIARYRAAMTVKTWADSLRKLQPRAKIVLMGDFNDEPTDSSVVHGLGTGWVNLWKPIHERGEGSYFHDKRWSAIDQIIVSPSLHQATDRWTCAGAGVYKREFLLEKNPKFYPAPFRTYAGDKYLGGYSDHLPVYLDLTVRKR